MVASSSGSSGTSGSGRSGQLLPVVHLADDRFELHDLRVRDLFGLAADEDALQRRAILQVLG